MIEVFKTNVNSRHHAQMLVEEIHSRFEGYSANFDLWDCDKILRIKSGDVLVEAEDIVNLLRQKGFSAELLEG
jgi:hypothetical protein